MNLSQEPTSVEEAAFMLEGELAESEKAKIAAFEDEGALHILHFTLGVFVRNHFRLWSEESQLMKNARMWAQPDAVSDDIIRALWRNLRAKSTH